MRIPLFILILTTFLLTSCQYMVGSPAYNKNHTNKTNDTTSVTEFICDDYDMEKDFFVVVENMPVLQGGLARLQENVIYPPAARRAGIEGRVTVQFIVNEKGYVECPRVIRGIGGGCDEAAVNAVLTAKFTPGRSGGRPVPVQYSLPIVFRL